MPIFDESTVGWLEVARNFAWEERPQVVLYWFFIYERTCPDSLVPVSGI